MCLFNWVFELKLSLKLKLSKIKIIIKIIKKTDQYIYSFNIFAAFNKYARKFSLHINDLLNYATLKIIQVKVGINEHVDT